MATFDFILLDAERPAYENYWPDLKRLMKPKGGVLIIDPEFLLGNRLHLQPKNQPIHLMPVQSHGV
jgi:predicted O-methyltransferase YrrM